MTREGHWSEWFLNSYRISKIDSVFGKSGFQRPIPIAIEYRTHLTYNFDGWGRKWKCQGMKSNPPSRMYEPVHLKLFTVPFFNDGKKTKRRYLCIFTFFSLLINVWLISTIWIFVPSIFEWQNVFDWELWMNFHLNVYLCSVCMLNVSGGIISIKRSIRLISDTW